MQNFNSFYQSILNIGDVDKRKDILKMLLEDGVVEISDDSLRDYLNSFGNFNIDMV